MSGVPLHPVLQPLLPIIFGTVGALVITAMITAYNIPLVNKEHYEQIRKELCLQRWSQSVFPVKYENSYCLIKTEFGWVRDYDYLDLKGGK